MPHNSVFASFAARQILTLLLQSTQTIADSNQFVRDNLVTYIIDKQEETLSNVFHQYLYIPQQNHNTEDRQPLHIPEDNLMNVSEIAPDTRAVDVNYKSKGSQSKKSSTGFSKGRTGTDRKEVQAYKSITKGLEVKGIEDRQNEQVLDYISKLRDYKEREEKEKAQSPRENQKPKPKISKGQKVVFDYEGNAIKGGEVKTGKFNQQIIESSIQNANKSKSNHESIKRQDKSTTIINKLLDRSTRNKTEGRGSVEFSSDKRDLIIDNLKLSNSKVKMVFDGHNVTKVDEESQPLLAKVHPKRSEFKINKTGPVSQNQRMKTELASLQVSLTLNQRPERRIRSRVHTQVQKPQKSERINIDSQAFKKAMLTQIDDAYHQLPKNRIRRLITNQPSGQSSNDSELTKIRERLNLKRSNEKLPQILSRYSNLQRDLIKQIRKKSKILYHDNS